MIIPPPNYLAEVGRICAERGVLLISDEVICGFGRTGEWFGCQTYGVQPDLITFAKAVTNGFQSLGGVAVGDRVADVLTAEGGEFAHGFTYSGHPVACAAGNRHLGHLPGNRHRGKGAPGHRAPLAQALGRAHPTTPSSAKPAPKACSAPWSWCATRPAGSASTPDHRAAIHCRNAAIGNGLMVRQVGDTIISAPPLIISREEIDELINRLTIALDATARHYGLNRL